MIPTIILFQQHSPRAVVEAGKQSQEEKGPKSNMSFLRVMWVILAELIAVLKIPPSMVIGFK